MKIDENISEEELEEIRTIFHSKKKQMNLRRMTIGNVRIIN